MSNAVLPIRGSTPTDADRKLVADLRRRLSLREPSYLLDDDDAVALVAAHRCRAEEAVWAHVTTAIADAQ
jgi:hypothetical protein